MLVAAIGAGLAVASLPLAPKPVVRCELVACFERDPHPGGMTSLPRA
jgi:hypothetical protein